MEDTFFTPDDLIHSYSRADAVEDGVLVDISEAAREVGIRFPVAITRNAFEACVTWTSDKTHQDERGRLHDVVWMLSCAIRRSSGGQRIDFVVLVVPNEGRGIRPVPVKLKALCGPGDNMEPVITVMFPEED